MTGTNEQRARELLAAECERDELPYMADCIRNEAMLTRVEARAVRAIAAALAEPKAGAVPEDFLTHRDAWRTGLLRARQYDDEADADYWDHEIAAFDGAYADLAAPQGKPGAPDSEAYRAAHAAGEAHGRTMAAVEAARAEQQGQAVATLRDALRYVRYRDDGDLKTLAERAELWMRESRVLIDMQRGLIKKQQQALIDRPQPAAVDAVRATPSGPWQPIETAPEVVPADDAVLVCITYDEDRFAGQRMVGEAYKVDGAWWWAGSAPGDYYTDAIEDQWGMGCVKLWMPMPEPPPLPPVRQPQEGERRLTPAQGREGEVG